MPATESTSATEPGSARSHIWTMAVTHQAFRREFELAPRIVRDLTPGQDARHRGAARWFAILLWFMHHHHENEDLLMYPQLAGRAPQELLDRMEQQHRALAAAIDRTQLALARWRLDDPQSGAALSAALDVLLPILVQHVDAEEGEIMPIVAEHLSAEQYARQGTRGNQADPHVLLMTFGAVLEQATAEEGEVMMSLPPEAVRRAWYDQGQEQYRQTMALLRGGLVPVARHEAPPGQSLATSAAQ